MHISSIALIKHLARKSDVLGFFWTMYGLGLAAILNEFELSQRHPGKAFAVASLTETIMALRFVRAFSSTSAVCA